MGKKTDNSDNTICMTLELPLSLINDIFTTALSTGRSPDEQVEHWLQMGLATELSSELRTFTINEEELDKLIKEKIESKGYLKGISPATILIKEFIDPLITEKTIDEICKGIGVTIYTLESIIQRDTPITFDIAKKLGRYFKTTPEFWSNLQTEYDKRLER